MSTGLVLVDLQHDFLERPGLVPSAVRVVAEAEHLLRAWRARELPVLHVHTRYRSDGTDRLAHWKQGDVWQCIEGTRGAAPPESLAPRAGEPVRVKRGYSAFGCPEFESALRDAGIDTVVLAGLYLHACVRATALDAQERGFRVWIAEDATGSPEPDHAELSRVFLADRATAFLGTPELLARVDAAPANPEPSLPVAYTQGRWLPAPQALVHERRNPSDWHQVIARVPIAGPAEVAAAAQAARGAQVAWGVSTPRQRAGHLEACAKELESRQPELADTLAREVGKPLREGRAEVGHAIAMLRHCATDLIEDLAEPSTSGSFVARLRPRGVVALVTPWNNPLAIPIGKLAPALVLGNAVVWKPAWEAPRTAMAVADAFAASGIPPGVLNLVAGDPGTARALMRHPAIDAVSITGSVATGASAAALCGRAGKALQAELGGNNAAIVLRDFDVAAHAGAVAQSAFSFGGQRCTSIQRFIVERAALEPFREALAAACENLVLGDPFDETTDLGPLISRSQQQRILGELDRAVADGARIVTGGGAPASLASGCWIRPTLLDDVAPESAIARQEIFGPVALLLPADDLDHAIAIANAVDHGLVAALFGGDDAARHRFADRIEAGMLQFAPGPLPVHPAAPFSAWKASGIGPPEHGRWDREFYTRPQALYGWPGVPV